MYFDFPHLTSGDMLVQRGKICQRCSFYALGLPSQEAHVLNHHKICPLSFHLHPYPSLMSQSAYQHYI